MPEPPRLTPTTVWYLEMASPEALVRRDGAGEVRRSGVPFGALNRFFYLEVGGDFDWIDRLGWTGDEWQGWAERTELWLVHDRGTPAGYAELELHVNLLRHGRRTCHAQRPACERCILRRSCPSRRV